MSSKSRRRRGSIDLGQLERDNNAENQQPNPQPPQQKQRSERKKTSRRSRKKSDEISKPNNNSDEQEKRDAKVPDEDDEKRDDDETSQLGDLPERPPSRCKQRAKSPYRKRGQSLRLSGGIPRELVLGGEPDASPGKRGSAGRSRSRSKSSRQQRRNSSGGLGSSSDPATNLWPQHTLPPPPPPPPEDNWEASFSSISTRSVGWTATTVSSSSSSLSETSEKKRQCNKPNVQPQRRGSMNDSLMSNTPKSKESTTTTKNTANSNGNRKPPQARRLSLPPSAPSAPPRSDPSHTPKVTNRKKIEGIDKPPTQRRPEPSPTKQDKKELKQPQEQTSPRESRGSTTTPASPPSRSRSKTPSSRSGSKRSVRSKTPNKQRKSLREALEAKRAAAAPLKSCLKSATATSPRRAGLSVRWDTRRSVTGEYFHSASSTASKDFLEHPDDDIRIWWSEKEIEHRWDRNLQIAFVFSEPYKELLTKAFACCRKEVDRATNEKKRPRLSAVDVCFSTLEQLSPARGLEAEICSAICERQAAHSRAVVDAQMFMWDEQASPATIERMLRHQSLKRSRLSSLFAQKMAEFDSQAAQDLIDIKTPARSPSFDA